ncbi:MAG: hypothetical protein ABW168_17050 [Sedimenticola sp.]
MKKPAVEAGFLHDNWTNALYNYISTAKKSLVTVQIAPEIRQFKAKNVSLHG